MNVSALVDLLEKCPPDSHVRVEVGDSSVTRVESLTDVQMVSSIDGDTWVVLRGDSQ